jgi:SAM-dependent methyltransferase
VTHVAHAGGGGHDLGDGLRRSVALFRAFMVEQTDPHRFYSLLARDSVNLVRAAHPLADQVLLDVGAGPVEFADCFEDAGARYIALDRDENVASVKSGGLVGMAETLPLKDESIDVVFSSNLIEHVRHPELVASEMVRVLRPGGVLVLSYTNWLSPWGGHETSPFHWFGGPRAVDRYTRKYGHPPKNIVDETLYRVSVGQMLRWMRSRSDVDVLTVRPRYLPPWASWLVRIPGLREVVTWNLLMVLRKR